MNSCGQSVCGSGFSICINVHVQSQNLRPAPPASCLLQAAIVSSGGSQVTLGQTWE